MFEQHTPDIEPSLPPAPQGLAHGTLATLYSNLTRLFGGRDWLKYEPETIQLHVGAQFDDLTLDKIEVVRTLVQNPEVQNVADFILHATDVVNNHVANFDMHPIPTTLELAWYVTSVKDLSQAAGFEFKPTPALVAVSAYLLREEGYSSNLAPFSFVDANSLEPGQTEADTKAKAEAIRKYIEHMESL